MTTNLKILIAKTQFQVTLATSWLQFRTWTGAKKVGCGSVSCHGDPLTVEQSASSSVNRLI